MSSNKSIRVPGRGPEREQLQLALREIETLKSKIVAANNELAAVNDTNKELAVLAERAKTLESIADDLANTCASKDSAIARLTKKANDLGHVAKHLESQVRKVEWACTTEKLQPYCPYCLMLRGTGKHAADCSAFTETGEIRKGKGT